MRMNCCEKWKALPPRRPGKVLTVSTPQATSRGRMVSGPHLHQFLRVGRQKFLEPRREVLYLFPGLAPDLRVIAGQVLLDGEEGYVSEMDHEGGGALRRASRFPLRFTRTTTGPGVGCLSVGFIFRPPRMRLPLASRLPLD